MTMDIVIQSFINGNNNPYQLEQINKQHLRNLLCCFSFYKATTILKETTIYTPIYKNVVASTIEKTGQQISQ